MIKVAFDQRTCQACSCRSNCTHAKHAPRILNLLPERQHVARQNRLREQLTPEFKQRYNKRAGIEGTLSQGTRAFDLRQSRYIGRAKTHLQHLAIAAAINLARFASWFTQIARAQTRTSAFAALASG